MTPSELVARYGAVQPGGASLEHVLDRVRRSEERQGLSSGSADLSRLGRVLARGVQRRAGASFASHVPVRSDVEVSTSVPTPLGHRRETSAAGLVAIGTPDPVGGSDNDDASGDASPAAERTRRAS